MHIEKGMRHMKAKDKKKKNADNSNCTLEGQLLFSTAMRKTFIEGVLQDIKGYFERWTDGKVEVSYEDFNLKDHEFGFKMKLAKAEDCTKQMFNEASNAFVNALDYMFSGGIEQYDVSFSSTSRCVEFEIVSNW